MYSRNHYVEPACSDGGGGGGGGGGGECLDNDASER